MKEHYTQAYFDSIGVGSAKSAGLVVPRLKRLYHPAMVLDVGCGTGAWSREFLKTDPGLLACGLDLYTSPQIDFPFWVFKKTDLNLPFHMSLPSDLVLCLEVAEHLEKFSADGLVNSLVRACRHVIVFSGATPGQGGGPTHINEQPHEYWHEKFENLGCFWHPLGSICPPEVDRWYKDNMFAYYPEKKP